MSSAPTEFETGRLCVRRWRPDDLAALLAVYGDASAMRWVGDGRPLGRAEALRWLEVTEANDRSRGYGMFAVALRGRDEAIGFCGLVHPGGQAEAELKYAFAREHWGRGFASEAASALLAHAARAFGLKRAIATVAPENRASHRVLAKAGMTPAGHRRNDDGTLSAVYEWKARGDGPDEHPR